MRIYKHFDIEFKTKHKIFIFTLDESGSFIRIVERNRSNSYVVEVDLGGGAWLCKVAEEALGKGKEGNFKRVFRGRDYQLVVDSSKNKAGCFLRVLKIHNGSTRNVIIPAEFEYRGWEKFGECLQSFFSKNISNMGGLNSTKQKGQRSNIQNVAGLSSVTRDTSLAVVILKKRSQTPWRIIKEQMQRKMGRVVDVVPFADDRAVTWCVNESEVQTLMEKDNLYRGRNFLAKIKRWNMYMHWGIFSLEANSLVGVQNSDITRGVFTSSLNDGITNFHVSETDLEKMRIHSVKTARRDSSGPNPYFSQVNTRSTISVSETKEFQRLKLLAREKTNEEDEADLALSTTHVTQEKDPSKGRPMAISDRSGLIMGAGVTEGRLYSDHFACDKIKEKERAKWVKQATADQTTRYITQTRNRFCLLNSDSSFNLKGNQCTDRVKEGGSIKMGLCHISERTGLGKAQIEYGENSLRSGLLINNEVAGQLTPLLGLDEDQRQKKKKNLTFCFKHDSGWAWARSDYSLE